MAVNAILVFDTGSLFPPPDILVNLPWNILVSPRTGVFGYRMITA